MKNIRDVPWKFLSRTGEQMSINSTDRWFNPRYAVVMLLLSIWAILWSPTLSKQQKSEWREKLNHLTGFHVRSLFLAAWIVLLGALPVAATSGVRIYHYYNPRGDLRLQILDDHGKPISDLDVNILPENSPDQVGIGSVTDGNGSVICESLHCGFYKVWVLRNTGTNEIESMSGRVLVKDAPLDEKWTFTPKAIPMRKFSDINFESGQADIDQYFRPTLSEVTDYFLTNRGTLFIYGHCDEVGSDERNFELGAKRVLEAKKHLNSLGASSKRMFLFSYGKSKPLDPGFPLSNEKNRRVEFCLVDE